MSTSLVSRNLVLGLLAGFAGVALSLYLYWPIGIGVATAVSLAVLASVQRQMRAEESGITADEDLLEVLLHPERV